MITIVSPDIHIPFQCPDAERLLHRLIRKHKPGKLVLLGDVLDCHAISTHNKIAYWRDNFEEELLQGYEYLKKLRKTCGPKTEIVYIQGNHERRWGKLVGRCLPQLSVTRNLLPHFLKLRDLDIKWVQDASVTPVWVNSGQGKIRCYHGDEVRGSSAFGARHALKIGKLINSSVLIGHTHRHGCISFTVAGKKGNFVAIELGHVADQKSKGMAYAYPHTDWTKCYAIFDDKKKDSPLPEFVFV